MGGLQDSFLLRPVLTYTIRDHESVLDQVSSEKDFTIGVLTRLCYDDGARIESSTGVTLSEEMLFLKMEKKKLKVGMEYIHLSKNHKPTSQVSRTMALKLNLYETIKTSNTTLEKTKLEEKTVTKVISGSFVNAKTLI